MSLSNINASNAGIYNCTAVVDSNDRYIMSSNIDTAHASIGLSVKRKQCIF